ncbi:MAG TPA: L,D-transpeptidase family protein [Firmicutes bacterium]|nr:L,D-transpeptidase family protein [Bacillota bacterium]
MERPLFVTAPLMRGSDVADVQLRLRQLGFYRGEIDGIYGPSTKNAVAAFQRCVDVVADGMVTGPLWDLLAIGVATSSGTPLPRPPGKVWLEVNMDKLTLTVFSDEEPYKTYPVAIGKWDTPTQVGEFAVIDKGYNPGGPFGTRWIGLNVPWGAYGIHGTNRPWSIGYPASAGCIRMLNQDVEELFEWVEVGTRVVITGSEAEYQLVVPVERRLKPGTTGQDVRYVQYCLRQLGFDTGPLDGWFGERMKKAVIALQKYYNLPVTGEVGTNELYVLGLR